MASEADRPQASARRKGRGMQVSLRLMLVLVAVAAVSLWGYRRWKAYHTSILLVYPVVDLVPKRPGADFGPLIDEIMTNVQPSSWTSGGAGTITPFFLNNSLIIRNNVVAHEEIAAFLRKKRRSAGSTATTQALQWQDTP